MEPHLVPLHVLGVGESAVVDQVLGGPELVHRLHELGLRCGALVEVVQAGSPCILRLAGQKLAVRSDDVVRVMVRLGGRS